MSNTSNDFIQRTRQLEDRLVDPRSSISIDGLLDSLIALTYDAEGLKKTGNFGAFYSRFHASSGEIREKRIHIEDFEQLRLIGRGAFGTVNLVRLKRTRQVFAMKTLSKFEMLKRSDSAFFWEERNIMAFSNSEWVVNLHYAFQDAKNLYMIMEYMAGGDLITLLNRYEISENSARFYCAEIILALDAIHSMGYIHRDVKPDNMLIDVFGHLKLADFGTCVKMDQNGSVRSDTSVGTPDYISPEILRLQGSVGVYGREVDWWSIGVVLYEMLTGETPFYADTLVGTYHKITHHKESLVFPPDVPISSEARHFICAALSDRSTRLGRNGVAEIKAHQFFNNQKDWSWETIRKVSPPIVPRITADDDTTNFEEIEANNEASVEAFSVSKTFVGNQLSFIGFSYSNEQQPFLNRRATANLNNLSHSELEQRLQESERLKTDLEMRSRRLQEELNAKCHDEQKTNSEIYDLERKNIVLTTEHKEAQRKYELELANRQTLEQRLEEMQRSFDYERNRTDQMGADNRDSTEKVTHLERQITELSEQLKVELESSTRLKKQNQDLQKASLQYERTHTELHDKYQDLIAIKLKLEQDAQLQQAKIDEEQNAKCTAVDKLRELEEKYNMATADLLKSKDRDALHMITLAELRQSTALLEREKANLQAEIDALHTKLPNGDGAHVPFREQTPGDKSKRASTVNGTYDDIHYSSPEMIEALEKKLESERASARRSHEELIQTQNQLRMLELNLKEVNLDYEQLSREWNDRLESDHQRRVQSERDVRQLQDQLNKSLSREEQMKDDVLKLQKENDYLDAELHRIRDEHETHIGKMTEYEEYIEISSKFSGLYRTQMQDLKDEIADLTKKFRQANDERQHLEDNQYNLTQQLEAINEKSKKESNSLNVLQEKNAELEKEKQIRALEVEALHAKFHTGIGLLDSEINSFRDRYQQCQYNLDQAIVERETMGDKLQQAYDKMHQQEGQLIDLRKKLESARVNKELALDKLQALITNPQQANPFFPRVHSATMSGRRQDRSREERNVRRNLEQVLEVERAKYKKLQSEKEEEISTLTEENNRLRRELDRRSLEKVKSRKNPESNTPVEPSPGTGVEMKTRLESWIQIPTRNIRKVGWKRQYAVLAKNKLVIYNSDKDQQAFITIHFDAIYHVRSVTQGDVLRVDPSLIPQIFQILYDSQSQALPNGHNDSKSNSITHSPESIEYRGHSFVSMTYRTATDCEACNRPCHSLISPPPCLVCTICHFRCHRQHYDDREDFVQSCRIYDSRSAKELLIMCASEHEQNQWVTILKTKIKPPATSARISPRSTNTSFRSLNSSISSLTSFNFGNPSSQSPSLKSSTLSTTTK